MRAGKYSFKEFFVNRYVEQVVVPEIQRDYVWGKTQLEGFLSSLVADFNSYSSSILPDISEVLSEPDPLLQKDFENFYRKRNYSANIGFIYAYCDDQYPRRYFLIDGQQRLTSIYILLLVLASRIEGADTFRKHYCLAGKPKLDYRVRSATSSFLANATDLLLEQPSESITDQSWLIDDYRNDVSIKSMLNNIDFFQKYLDNNPIRDEAFFEYLQDYTEFWYFDTNISEQGENLYIYLNARGEQVQYNENIKADLLSRLNNDTEKNKWGKTWEEWQDLFWKKRSAHTRGKGNSNADKGFNAFVDCITGLKLYLSDDKRYFKSNKSANDSSTKPPIASILTLEDISSYLNALRFIDEQQEFFSNEYEYSGWLKGFKDVLWGVLNNGSTDWYVDHTSPQLFSTETRNMSFCWGVLHWINSALFMNLESNEIFRQLRHFYLRFNNNIRAVGQVKQSVSNLLNGIIINQNTDSEEYIKEQWLLCIPGSKRNSYESIIWQIEDHPINLDGSDVGARNISHLVNFESKLSLNDLADVRDVFYKIFPLDNNKNKELQSLLLHYGNYWRRVSPLYYENYEFHNWKYITRDENGYFGECLRELIASKQTVNQLLEKKRQQEPSKASTDLRNQLLWYNYHLGERMWTQGSYIAIGGGDEYPDHIFSERKVFRNTKGDYRGGMPKDLFDLLNNTER